MGNITSMRGQQTLYNKVFTSEMTEQKASGIGRSKALISKRDERMIYRYYYYTHIIGKNYPDAIQVLSEQFDLSQIRVIVCINENNTRLKEVTQREKPTQKELKKKYPWMNWFD